MPETQLDPLIEGYLAYVLEVKRLTHRSVIDMRCSIKRVVTAMEHIRPGMPLWKLSLQDFLQWCDLERSRGRSAGSIDKMFCHVRGLLYYAWRTGRCNRNVLEGFYLKDSRVIKKQRVLSMEEADLLIKACRSKTSTERRDRVMVLLLYGCGLRTGELCSLDVRDVDHERQEIIIRRGKGDRQRRIPVPDRVWTELLAYLLERKGRIGPLFRTECKRVRIASKDVVGLMQDLVRRAGLSDDIKPKTLRHSFASHLSDRGVDFSVISSLMGHRSVQETNAYLHALPGRKYEAVTKLNIGREDKS